MRHGYLLPFLKSLIGTSIQDCIDFPGAISSTGYGDMIENGKRENAHRIMCRHAHGPAPADKPFALHKCLNNKKCINPNHLYWGTPQQNNLDRWGSPECIRVGEQ